VEVKLRRTSALAPHLPIYQWTIGIYFLAYGNTQEAFQHLRVVLVGRLRNDRTIFNVAWKTSADVAHNLQQLISHEFPAEFSFLN
jgi:hypothetical protein